MPRQLRAFAAFWYDFLIGDDWLIPVMVIAGLAATYGLAHARADRLVAAARGGSGGLVGQPLARCPPETLTELPYGGPM